MLLLLLCKTMVVRTCSVADRPVIGAQAMLRLDRAGPGEGLESRKES